MSRPLLALVVAAFAVGSAACATGTPTAAPVPALPTATASPTATAPPAVTGEPVLAEALERPAAIELVPVVLGELGVSSVVPRGWTEMPGAAFESGEATLQFLALPSNVPLVPTDDGFELLEQRSVGGRDWELFALETTDPVIGKTALLMAVMTANDMTYAIVLAAPADLADQYAETVAIPAIEAFDFIDTAEQFIPSYDEVLAQMAASGAGAALVVDRHGQLEFDDATGTVAVDDPTPLTTDTPFRTGSTTKPMTAVVILRLAEMGVVDVDETIDSYLPSDLVDRVHVLDGVNLGREITIRMLLRHTSGLPDRFDTDYVEAIIADPDRRWTPTDLVEWRIGHLDPLFAPGNGFSYSDDGFVLLGLIAQATTGRPLQDLYRELVFDPAGMASTFLEGQEPARGAPIANNYYGDLDATGWHPSIDWAGGGIASTPKDLVDFARALAAGTLFDDAATVEAMIAPGPYPTSIMPPSAAMELGYGLGLSVFDIDGTPVFGHGGGWGSMLLVAPDDDVVVLANINNSEGSSAAFTGAVQAMRLALRAQG